MSEPPNLQPPPPIREEVQPDHYRFRMGDLVPAWIEHAEGAARMTFTVDVSVHIDMQGGYWIIPDVPTEFPIHVEGYGEHVPVKIHGQGRAGVRVLNRQPIDVRAYLNLPQG